MILDHQGRLIQSPPQARQRIRKRIAWRSPPPPIESGEPTEQRLARAIERTLYTQVSARRP
ncbi:hypothetical protein [Lamprobacter modestohalophilus]|nr:hypothetical protein [Lamprobacter modestohalophilus]